MVHSPEAQRLIVQPEISDYLRDFQGAPDPLLDALSDILACLSTDRQRVRNADSNPVHSHSGSPSI